MTRLAFMAAAVCVFVAYTRRRRIDGGPDGRARSGRRAAGAAPSGPLSPFDGGVELEADDTSCSPAVDCPAERLFRLHEGRL